MPVVANLAGPASEKRAIFSAPTGLPKDTGQAFQVRVVTSTYTKSPVTRRPMALRAAVYVLPVLGALLVDTAGAQGIDDLSHLIFEVAPLPIDGAAPAPGGVAGNGGNVANAAAAPSPAEPVNVQADISAYRARINDTQANANPYSHELREQYDALGTLLQQNGEHEEAIKAFEAAMHIDRVNAGLYTLDQIPVVEKIMASHEALGNASEVDDFHGYLFYIKQRSYEDGDPRLLAAQEEWADWNIESYMKDSAEHGEGVTFQTGGASASRTDYVAVQDPRNGSFTYIPRAQMMTAMNPLGRAGYFDPTFMQTHGVDAERVIDDRLRTARTYYEDIVEATTPDEANPAANPESATNTDDTHRVERKLANVAYAIKNQLEGIDTVEDEGSLYFNNRMSQNYSPPQAVTRGYQRNRDALQASAEKLEQDPSATALEKAQAWIDVGDWNTGFDYPQRGTEAYKKAWDLLRGAGLDDTAIERIFMPKPLVPAPAFAIHRYSREIFGIDPDASIDYKGHMDLTLDVNRYGDVAGIKIDSAVPEVSQVLRSELIDYLRAQKMRPAFVNGEPVKRDNVKLRYYYSY
jgi:tetratricopeptide (TPR) repeat protein